MPLSKSDLRKTLRARRAEFVRVAPDFAAQLATHADALDIADGTLVGAYVALPDEADPHLLLKQLESRGCTIAFPRVAAKAAPLVYHHCKPGDALQPGTYGIPEPSREWPIAHPQVLLVPLLAFDKHGHRLGYGGGFYDRTIAALKPVRTIGIAYAGQEVEALPNEPHDVALDMIATEAGVLKFK